MGDGTQKIGAHFLFFTLGAHFVLYADRRVQTAGDDGNDKHQDSGENIFAAEKSGKGIVGVGKGEVGGNDA